MPPSKFSWGSIATCPFAPVLSPKHFFPPLWPFEAANTFSLGFAAAPDADMRRYSQPQGDSLAMVFESTDGAPPDTRDLVVWPRSATVPIHRMSDRSEHIDPLTYALFFPDGTPGWHDRLLHAEQYRTPCYQRLTAGQFYTHRLMIRDFDAAIPHAGGLLFQQYILDAYCRSEAMRMNWFRQNQAQLRSETFDELQAFASSTADVDDMPAQRCGTPIILPSTYAGSPRNMYALYLDTMAVVRRFGRPTYFITFTANPSWSEITAHLLPGQLAADRPDLVARVFHIKLKHLLKDLTQHQWFGRALAWTWVVEFQKRGLPHAHILLTVSAADRPNTPEAVDERVCAEIPPNTDGTQANLLEIVSKCMLRGPCGVRNPHAPCIREDGSCKNDFPKDFSSPRRRPHATGSSLPREDHPGRKV